MWALPLRYFLDGVSQISCWLTLVGLGRSNRQIVRLWRHISTPQAERRGPYLLTIICYIHAGACISRILRSTIDVEYGTRRHGSSAYHSRCALHLHSLCTPLQDCASFLLDLILHCR